MMDIKVIGILNIIGNQEKYREVPNLRHPLKGGVLIRISVELMLNISTQRYMKILILALQKNGGKNKQNLKEDIQIQKIKKYYMHYLIIIMKKWII